MKGRKCARCERDQTDTATICHACGRETRKALTGITDLWPHLLEAIGKQTRMGQRAENKPTAPDSRPIPVDLTASQVATNARGVLTGWVRILAEDNRLDLPADTVPAMCAWLDAHRKQLRRHEAAREIVDEIIYTSGQIHRVVDYPDERGRIYAGPCPEVDEDGPCPGEVYAIIPTDKDKPGYMECRSKKGQDSCGAQWDTTQWTRLGARIQRREEQIRLQKSYGKAAG